MTKSSSLIFCCFKLLIFYTLFKNRNKKMYSLKFLLIVNIYVISKEKNGFRKTINDIFNDISEMNNTFFNT